MLDWSKVVTWGEFKAYFCAYIRIQSLLTRSGLDVAFTPLIGQYRLECDSDFSCYNNNNNNT